MAFKGGKLSAISKMHYIKLLLRGGLFAVALAAYVCGKTATVLGAVIWLFLMSDMISRLFPSKLESMGCQKQFSANYAAKNVAAEPINQSWRKTFAVAAVWMLLNAVIGAMYFSNVIDKGVLMLISLFYSVCDIVCILFFCPFQTWFMKNRCCVSCRIYNWDFAMMFTPLVFIPSMYAYSLLGCALLILLRWEVALKLRPEWFSTATNANLDCKNCKEKLCSHKKQLRSFIQKNNLM